MPNQRLILCFSLFYSLVTAINAQNDKQVLGDAVFTPEEIAAGAEVTFLIRFQNFGIDTAENILVRDTLDPRFDASTLTVLDASHNYQLLRDHALVRWYFEDIQLPAFHSFAPENSNSTGYVLFTVQPLTFLNPGQTIHNRACIVFDDQQPVCTNEATIWIDEGADIEEPRVERNFSIVPNPNYGRFQIRKKVANNTSSGQTVEWWVSDMTGKIIWDGKTQDISDASNEVMLERPAPGLYMLWKKENGGLQVEQFAVVR